MKFVRLTTQKKGTIDIVLDSTGGSQIKKDMHILRPGGRVIGIGVAALNDRSISKAVGLLGGVISMITMSAIDMLLHSVSFCGVNLKRLGDQRPELLAECLLKVRDLFSEGKLKTKIHKVYDWKDITQAHKDIESRGTSGKLILSIDPIL